MKMILATVLLFAAPAFATETTALAPSPTAAAQSAPQTQSPAAIAAPDDHENTRARLDTLETLVTTLTERANAQDTLIGYLLSMSEEQPAVIDTTGTNVFALAKTRFGNFPVSIEDVTPYMDGYKLTIAVANPTTLRFAGVDVDVRWGEGQRKRLSFADEVAPRKWTTVPIILAPVSPDDLRNISVQLHFESVGF